MQSVTTELRPRRRAKKMSKFALEKEGRGKLSLKNMDTILFWALILVGSALFVYLVPYKNIKIIQKLQRESLQKLDTIIELLKTKN